MSVIAGALLSYAISSLCIDYCIVRRIRLFYGGIHVIWFVFLNLLSVFLNGASYGNG